MLVGAERSPGNRNAREIEIEIKFSLDLRAIRFIARDAETKRVKSSEIVVDFKV